MSTARILVAALGGTAVGLALVLLERASAGGGPPTGAMFVVLVVTLASLALAVALYARGRYREQD